MNDIVARTIADVRDYTMGSSAAIRATIELAFEAIDSGRGGDLVECGAWLGGASFAMLLAQRYRYGRVVKPVWMFDSFEGLPPVDERDGPAAAAYQRNVGSPTYLDNCRAPLPAVLAAIERFGFSPDEAIVVPGWFNDTVPKHRAALASRGIGLLRVDCDWYEPVSYVLDELVQYVPVNGRIILDDYYSWDGCVRATHAFLTRNDYPWRLYPLPEFAGVFLTKAA